jgi:acetyl esterase/lipase
MPLDPWLLKQFKHLRDLPPFDATAGFADPKIAARFAAFARDPEPWVLPDAVTVTDTVIAGPHGPIPLRLYRPAGEASGPRPALLWMHGGSFVSGDLDMNESHMVSAELAVRAGAVVVAVDYRLAVGGVKYPVPLDDVVAAWQWLVTEAVALGADPARLDIGGASAGGNLAAAAAMRVRDEGGVLPRAMLLAYARMHFPTPSLDIDMLEQMTALPPILRFPPSFHEWSMRTYLGRITDIPAGVMPGHFALTGMPPAVIAPAEYDDLRASVDLFVRQLADSGVPVQVQLGEGMVHGYLNRAPSIPAVDRTLDFFADALRR